jgi:pullulanase/glycogen debranching enzyme
MSQQISVFWVQIFYLKKYNFNTKGRNFWEKNDPNLPDFEKNWIKSTDFYNRFQQAGSQNIEGFFFFKNFRI